MSPPRLRSLILSCLQKSVIVALLVGATLPNPTAAQSEGPKPPTTFVLDLWDYVTFSSYGSWLTKFNLTFKAPSNDLLLNNSYNLSVQANTAVCTHPDCSVTLTLIPKAIPGHFGWFWAAPENFNFALKETSTNELEWGVRNVTIHAYNSTTGLRSVESCRVQVDFSKVDPLRRGIPNSQPPVLLSNRVPNEAGVSTYNACGEEAYLPSISGVRAITQTTYETGISRVNISWPILRSDPDQTNGSYDYYSFHRFSDPVNPGLLYRGSRDLQSRGYVAGWRYADVSSGGNTGDINPLWIQVLARNNMTNQRTNLSCAVGATAGVLFSQGTCGSIGEVAPILSGDSPIYPFLDLAFFASEFGMSVTSFAFLMAGIWIFFLTMGGVILFESHRTMGGVMGAVLGIGSAGAMNLIPKWMLVVVILIAAMLLLYIFRGNKGGEA